MYANANVPKCESAGNRTTVSGNLDSLGTLLYEVRNLADRIADKVGGCTPRGESSLKDQTQPPEDVLYITGQHIITLKMIHDSLSRACDDLGLPR